MKSLRVSAAVLSFLSGGVHLVLAPEHLAESRALGTAFALNALAFFTIGIALLLRPRLRAWVALAAVSAATVVAYVVVSTGGVGHRHAHPEALGLLVTGVEIALVAIAAWVLVVASTGSRLWPAVSLRSRIRSISIALSIPLGLAIVTGASVVVAVPSAPHQTGVHRTEGSIRPGMGNEHPAKHGHVTPTEIDHVEAGDDVHGGEHSHDDANGTDIEP